MMIHLLTHKIAYFESTSIMSITLYRLTKLLQLLSVLVYITNLSLLTRLTGMSHIKTFYFSRSVCSKFTSGRIS